MTLETESMKKLNKQEIIPVFQGVFYNFKSAPRKMTVDDDEFVDIEEDEDVENQKIKHVGPPKKQIDDLFDLLNTIPVMEPTTHSQNISNNFENKNSQYTGIENNFTHNATSSGFNISNIPNADLFSANMSNGYHIKQESIINHVNNDDDEFVDIEEDSVRHSPVKDTSNQLSTAIEIEQNVENKSELVKEINFHDMIFNSKVPHKSQNVFENEKVEQISQNNQNDKEIRNIPLNKGAKAKVSLDDLFFDLNVEVTNTKESEPNIPSNTQTPEVNQIVFDNASDKDFKQEDSGQDEFCDVEESQNEQNNIEEINSIPADNNHSNLFNFTENKEEPKVSIANYTPDDFLNEFKKENKIFHDEDKMGKTLNEEFEFVVKFLLINAIIRKKQKTAIRNKKILIRI
jgi:hypothetical protein